MAVRFMDLFLPCPACGVLIDAEVQFGDGVVEVLRYELCPNELGPHGHQLNVQRDLHPAARQQLNRVGLL
jgi:hypothetical protein